MRSAGTAGGPGPALSRAVRGSDHQSGATQRGATLGHWNRGRIRGSGGALSHGRRPVGTPVPTCWDTAKGRACGAEDGEGTDRGETHLRRGRHHRSGGPRPGPQAARDVHRLDRPDRPPPPRLGDRGQRRRRGHGRLLRPHRRHPPGRRRRAGGRQRPRHPDRHPSEVQGQDGGRGRLHRPPRRREVRRRRWVQGLRWTPRRGQFGGQRPVDPAAPGDRPRRRPPRHGVRRRGQAHGQARA